MIENDVECLPNQGTRENLARSDNRVKHLLALWKNGSSFFFFQDKKNSALIYEMKERKKGRKGKKERK